MKQSSKLIYKMIIVIIAMSISGCLKDKIDLPKQNVQDYNLVYMPQAVNSPNVSTLLLKSDDQFLIYGANYGGTGYPNQDIPVNFTVSKDSVAAYNKKNHTNYPLLPDISYKLSTTSSTIPKGQLSTPPLKIAIKTEGVLDLFKEYLLPVTLGANSGISIKFNQNLLTTYYLVKASLNLADFPEFDKSAWKIISFSSEEINGEGPNNGRAIFAIDNNINSFWHTRYSDLFSPPPHFLIIDMNANKTVHGVSFVARQNENRGRPMQVTVQTSLNGTDWVSSDDFSLKSTNDQQRLFFLSGFKNARYLKLIITKMYDGATHTHLAEFGAF